MLHAGLDSASTFTIVQSLANWAHATDATIVVALLQPEPQVYDLFDDIHLLVRLQPLLLQMDCASAASPLGVWLAAMLLRATSGSVAALLPEQSACACVCQYAMRDACRLCSSMLQLHQFQHTCAGKRQDHLPRPAH